MLRITPQNLPLDIIKDPANFRQLSASFLTSYRQVLIFFIKMTNSNLVPIS